MTNDERPLTLRQLAARVASHRSVQQAIVDAINAALPLALEEVAGDMAAADGGTLRLYLRKRPTSERRRRDDAILAMLAQGKTPQLIAASARCSVSHVYNVRATLRKSSTEAVGAPLVSKTEP